MKFRTEIFPDSPPFSINLDRGALLIGSCFSDYMAERLKRTLWGITANPCGTLFNPASIARLIELACSDRADLLSVVKDSLFFHGSLWRSYLLPTDFTSPEKSECEEKVLTAIGNLRQAILDSDTMFVTFGTANVYELTNRRGYIVTNCHKLPANSFRRYLMSVGSIVELWQQTVSLIRSLNSDMKIVFTVSPVRHIKDGYHLNTLSKSTLHLATAELCASLDDCWYFPAYELVTDDLRDYRFYDSDLVHPSSMAVDYLRDKLFECCFSNEQLKVIRQGEELWRRLNHRPLHPDTPEASLFREETERLAADFLSAHPGFRY